jgi:hypothetical protein
MTCFQVLLSTSTRDPTHRYQPQGEIDWEALQAYAGIAAVAGELDVGDAMFSPPLIQRRPSAAAGTHGRGGGGGNGLLSPPVIRRGGRGGYPEAGNGFLSPPTGMHGRGGTGYPEVTPLRPPRETVSGRDGAQRFNEYEGAQRAAVRVPVQAGCRYLPITSSWGPGRRPSASSYTQKRLSLYLPPSILPCHRQA